MRPRTREQINTLNPCYKLENEEEACVEEWNYDNEVQTALHKRKQE